VIFAGRAAHLITNNLPGGFHIRLVAPLNCGSSAAGAAGLRPEYRHPDPAGDDNARRRYVQSNFERDINDPTSTTSSSTRRRSSRDAAQLVLRAMMERVSAPAVVARPSG